MILGITTPYDREDGMAGYASLWDLGGLEDQLADDDHAWPARTLELADIDGVTPVANWQPGFETALERDGRIGRVGIIVIEWEPAVTDTAWHATGRAIGRIEEDDDEQCYHAWGIQPGWQQHKLVSLGSYRRLPRAYEEVETWWLHQAPGRS